MPEYLLHLAVVQERERAGMQRGRKEVAGRGGERRVGEYDFFDFLG